MHRRRRIALLAALLLTATTSAGSAVTGQGYGHQPPSATSLRVSVTATNKNGSTTATSAQTGVVAPPPSPVAAPTNTALPQITGTVQAGQTLSASTGTWSGSPTTYGYGWQRCSSTGTSCV